MDIDKVVLVTGAGGFIGGHLWKRLDEEGFSLLAVDNKPWSEWHQRHGGRGHTLDLRDPDIGIGADYVFNLACDMGGMGFIKGHDADCMSSVLINTNLLRTAAWEDVERYFYASSACVYNQDCQTSPDSPPLHEEDAYPAMPEDGYGWEKLFSERMCKAFSEEKGVPTRVARLHNVYGPHGTWNGGREKAPAAICRKVIEAKLSGHHEIEIWGDGEQTRTFMYVDDCVEGILRIMDSDYEDPLNLGSTELVSVNQLVDLVEEIAGIRCKRTYDLSKPQGVRGRSSDNTRLKAVTGWEPSISLRDGLERTFGWIRDQMT